MEASTRRLTGTDDEDPNIIWFAEECQRNHVRVEALVSHAERVGDSELVAFFRRAQAASHRLRARQSNRESASGRLRARR